MLKKKFATKIIRLVFRRLRLYFFFEEFLGKISIFAIFLRVRLYFFRRILRRILRRIFRRITLKNEYPDFVGVCLSIPEIFDLLSFPRCIHSILFEKNRAPAVTLVLAMPKQYRKNSPKNFPKKKYRRSLIFCDFSFKNL
jgi:hypothetical protein